METAKLIVDLIGKLIWPIITLVIILLFRKPLIGLVPYIKKVKAGGVELTLEQVKGIAEEIAEEVVESKIPPQQNAQKTIYQKNNLEESALRIPNDEAGNNTLLAFTANQSFEKNLEYDIYYDPALRNHNTPFKYIGLYKEGEIFAVGRVIKIVYCNYDNGQLISTHGEDLNKLSQDETNRIKKIIENTDYYELQEGCKFFLVDKFHTTHYTKSSDYPLRAKKYIWLNEIEGFKEGMRSEKLAELLNGKDWE